MFYFPDRYDAFPAFTHRLLKISLLGYKPLVTDFFMETFIGDASQAPSDYMETCLRLYGNMITIIWKLTYDYMEASLKRELTCITII